jgi:hypothetical protein
MTCVPHAPSLTATLQDENAVLKEVLEKTINEVCRCQLALFLCGCDGNRWASCRTRLIPCKISCKRKRLRSRWPTNTLHIFASLNAQLQALRSMSENLREALDKAKTQAAQSSAALAQSQARETILTADVECKVNYHAHTLQFIAHPAFSPPPPPPFTPSTPHPLHPPSLRPHS